MMRKSFAKGFVLAGISAIIQPANVQQAKGLSDKETSPTLSTSPSALAAAGEVIEYIPTFAAEAVVFGRIWDQNHRDEVVVATGHGPATKGFTFVVLARRASRLNALHLREDESPTPGPGVIGGQTAVVFCHLWPSPGEWLRPRTARRAAVLLRHRTEQSSKERWFEISFFHLYCSNRLGKRDGRACWFHRPPSRPPAKQSSQPQPRLVQLRFRCPHAQSQQARDLVVIESFHIMQNEDDSIA